MVNESQQWVGSAKWMFTQSARVPASGHRCLLNSRRTCSVLALKIAVYGLLNRRQSAYYRHQITLYYFRSNSIFIQKVEQTKKHERREHQAVLRRPMISAFDGGEIFFCTSSAVYLNRQLICLLTCTECLWTYTLMFQGYTCTIQKLPLSIV